MNERWSMFALVAGLAGIAYLIAKTKRETPAAASAHSAPGAVDGSAHFAAAAEISPSAQPTSTGLSSLVGAAIATDVQHGAQPSTPLQTIVTIPDVVDVDVRELIFAAATVPAEGATVQTIDAAPPPQLISISSGASAIAKANATKINSKALTADRGPDSRTVPMHFVFANYGDVDFKGTLGLIFNETGYPDGVMRGDRIDSPFELAAGAIAEASFTYGLVAQHRNPSTWATPTTKPIAVRVEIQLDGKSIGSHGFFAT